MMQLFVIINVYVKATSGFSRFFSLSSRSCFNAFIIYKNYHLQPKYAFMEFKLEIIHNMLVDAGSHLEPSSEFDRLRSHHFAEVIPATEKREKPQKKCLVCRKWKVQKECQYQCGQCDAPWIVTCSMFYDLSH